MLIISLVIIIAFVTFILATLKLRSLTSAILAGYLLFVTHVIIVFLIANIFSNLANQSLILILQISFLFITFIFWAYKGRPPLLNNIKIFITNLKSQSIKQIAVFWPIIILGLGVGITYAFYAYLVLIIPPNNYDSLHTHLARIGYWLQNNSLNPWETFNTKQIFYPINISLQVFWTILFQGTDKFSGFIQWFASLASIVVVYGIARLLGAKKPQAFFASFIWSSFPIILFQSTSTQLDLASSVLFMISIYFLVLGIKSKDKNNFSLAGLALALALGSKHTVYFLLPGLILFIIFQVNYWKNNFRHLINFSISSIVFFIVLSSYIFTNNLITFGNIAGPDEVVAQSVGGDVEGLIYNIPRLIYQAVDFSGLPKSLENTGNRGKAKVMEAIEKHSGFSLESSKANAPNHQFFYRSFYQPTEDSAWFGFTSLIILFPTTLMIFIDAIKKRDMIILGLVILSFSFLPVNALLRWGWDPYQGRYFMASYGIISPFMYICVKPRISSKLIQIIALVLAGTSILCVTLFNPSKPLKSNDVEIFTAHRSQLQSLSGGKTLWDFIYMIDRSVSTDGVIGFYSEDTIHDYVLFGEHFSRTVIPIVNSKLLADEDWLKSQNIRFLLVNLSRGSPSFIALRLVEYDEVKSEWMLYTWSKVN